MLPIGQIAEGFINNALGKEEDLFQKRVDICRQCKLHKIDSIFGETCNSKLYLNPLTDETSISPKSGFFNGCGCVLASKCRVPQAKCPLSRW